MILPPELQARRKELFCLEAHLKDRIRGQAHAMEPLAAAIIRAELGLQRPGRFLLLGPTGVGKTESVLAFTEFVYGTDRLARFDCSEFQGAETLPSVLGDRAGDRGRFGALDGQGHGGTLLFDEIEKAGDSFQRLLLQILEPGRVTLACGETLDLSCFHVVCTSNIASNEILDLRHSSPTTLERHVLGRAREWLRPEILNRFDEALVYRPLEFETQVEIVSARLEAHVCDLRAHGYVLAIGPDVTEFLARQGIDRKFGARPLLRSIRKYVGNAVAENLRAGSDGSGLLEVHPKDECLVVSREQTTNRRKP